MTKLWLTTATVSSSCWAPIASSAAHAGGRFSFGPYQGSDKAAYGYRLGTAPGRRLELTAMSHRGVRVVAARDQAN